MTAQEVNELAASLCRTALFDDECNPRTEQEARLYADGIEAMRMNIVRVIEHTS